MPGGEEGGGGGGEEGGGGRGGGGSHLRLCFITLGLLPQHPRSADKPETLDLIILRRKLSMKSEFNPRLISMHHSSADIKNTVWNFFPAKWKSPHRILVGVY